MAARGVDDLAFRRCFRRCRVENSHLLDPSQPDRLGLRKSKGAGAKPALFLFPQTSGLVGIKGCGHLANARNLITTRFLSVGQTLNGLKFGGKWFT
jgi:hypothetical protein